MQHQAEVQKFHRHFAHAMVLKGALVSHDKWPRQEVAAIHIVQSAEVWRLIISRSVVSVSKLHEDVALMWKLFQGCADLQMLITCQSALDCAPFA